MGFSKATAIIDDIEIPMSFRVKDERAPGTEVEVNVSHFFKLPTAFQREKYQNECVDVKRGKPQSRMVKANRTLWNVVIARVSGYDDITNPSDPDAFREYFNDDIGSIHIDAAITRLMNIIGSGEADFEKK